MRLTCMLNSTMWRGTGGWSPREKEAGGQYGRREYRGGRRNCGENYATFCSIFRNRKKCKEVGVNKKGWEPGIKGTGSRKFKPRCLPSPPQQYRTGLNVKVESIWLSSETLFSCDCKV